jgi:hypothetical protein
MNKPRNPLNLGALLLPMYLIMTTGLQYIAVLFGCDSVFVNAPVTGGLSAAVIVLLTINGVKKRKSAAFPKTTAVVSFFLPLIAFVYSGVRGSLGFFVLGEQASLNLFFLHAAIVLTCSLVLFFCPKYPENVKPVFGCLYIFLCILILFILPALLFGLP